MKLKNVLKMVAIVGVATLFLGTLAPAEHGHRGNSKIKRLIHLTAGPAAPNANGIAKIFMKTKGNAMQRFQVVGANLTVGASYTLVVDGNRIETKQAVSEQGDDDDQGGDDQGDTGDQQDTGGAVEFLFVRSAHGEPDEGELLPSVLDPVTKIKHVELDDANGMIVLSGDFPQP